MWVILPMWKRIWNDPVWSKVISAAILAAVALVGTYLLDWWPHIGLYITGVVSFAFRDSLIPNWLSTLFVLLALPTVVIVIALGWQLLAPSEPSRPAWQAYTSDHFFGLRWRWRYYGHDVSHMHTFCPHCDYQIFPEHASAYAAVERISFNCESCGKYLGLHDESYDSLQSKALRFVQQKLRNGTWNQNES